MRLSVIKADSWQPTKLKVSHLASNKFPLSKHHFASCKKMSGTSDDYVQAINMQRVVDWGRIVLCCTRHIVLGLGEVEVRGHMNTSTIPLLAATMVGGQYLRKGWLETDDHNNRILGVLRGEWPEYKADANIRNKIRSNTFDAAQYEFDEHTKDKAKCFVTRCRRDWGHRCREVVVPTRRRQKMPQRARGGGVYGNLNSELR